MTDKWRNPWQSRQCQHGLSEPVLALALPPTTERTGRAAAGPQGIMFSHAARGGARSPWGERMFRNQRQRQQYKPFRSLRAAALTRSPAAEGPAPAAAQRPWNELQPPRRAPPAATARDAPRLPADGPVPLASEVMQQMMRRESLLALPLLCKFHAARQRAQPHSPARAEQRPEYCRATARAAAEREQALLEIQQAAAGAGSQPQPPQRRSRQPTRASTAPKSKSRADAIGRGRDPWLARGPATAPCEQKPLRPPFRLRRLLGSPHSPSGPDRAGGSEPTAAPRGGFGGDVGAVAGLGDQSAWLS